MRMNKLNNNICIYFNMFDIVNKYRSYMKFLLYNF